MRRRKNRSRSFEKEVRRSQKKPAAKKTETKKPTFYSEVELSLKDSLHRRVKITPAGNGKGTITLEFFNDAELSEFAKKLAGE